MKCFSFAYTHLTLCAPVEGLSGGPSLETIKMYAGDVDRSADQFDRADRLLVRILRKPGSLVGTSVPMTARNCGTRPGTGLVNQVTRTAILAAAPASQQAASERSRPSWQGAGTAGTASHCPAGPVFLGLPRFFLPRLRLASLRP